MVSNKSASADLDAGLRCIDRHAARCVVSLLALFAALAPALWSHAQETTARVAIIPDTQNYVTTIDLHPPTAAQRQLLLEQMISAIIAWRPAFVLQVGDLTDSTGGCDQVSGTAAPCLTGAGRLADDPNSYGTPADDEWQRIRTLAFNRLKAAGIPFLAVVGNHDSGADYERWFPASEFQAGPGYRAVDFRMHPWTDPTIPDTTQRAALFATPIGTICVIGLPYNGLDANTAWVVSQIGCGAGRPTIFVQHGGVSIQVRSAINAAPLATRDMLIMQVYGHVIPGLGAPHLRQNGTATFPREIFSNWQEVRYGDPNVVEFGHTGLSWWTKWTLDPLSGSTILAHNPHLNGTSQSDNPAHYVNNNGTLGWGFDWCARFGCSSDLDGDGVTSADNCPQIANANQADGDLDGVGDACDSCLNYANPRVTPDVPTFLAANPWATLTGEQRDDDHDGYGNRCDAKFVGSGPLVGPPDLVQFRDSNGENRLWDVCGTSSAMPCAIFDLDESGTLISASDLIRFRDLNGLPVGPRCAACPLPCAAGTAGTCQ